jgi:hypothetical protein
MGAPDRIGTDAGRKVLRHKNAVAGIELHHRIRIGLIERLFILARTVFTASSSAFMDFVLCRRSDFVWMR